MPEISCDSVTNSVRTCLCGEIARCFTSRTQLNPGRKIYKCPKPKSENCGFWKWEDNRSENFLVQINDLNAKLEVAMVKMVTLRDSLNAVKIERDNLKRKIGDFREKKLLRGEQIKELGRKIIEDEDVLYCFIYCVCRIYVFKLSIEMDKFCSILRCNILNVIPQVVSTKGGCTNI